MTSQEYSTWPNANSRNDDVCAPFIDDTNNRSLKVCAEQVSINSTTALNTSPMFIDNSHGIKKLTKVDANRCSKMTVETGSNDTPCDKSYRCHIVDIAQPELLAEIMNDIPMSVRICDASIPLIHHPCPVKNIFMAEKKGPLTFSVHLPKFDPLPVPRCLERSSNDTTYNNDLPKVVTEFVTDAITSVFHEVDNAHVIRLNLGDILRAHSDLAGDIKHIVPRSIKMNVLQVESSFPLKAVLWAPCAVSLPTSSKNHAVFKDVCNSKMQCWSDPQGVIVKKSGAVPSSSSEWSDTNTNSSKTPTKTEYEKFYNFIWPTASKDWTVYEAPQCIHDADFSRWVALQPSVLLNDIETPNSGFPGHWIIKKTTSDASLSVPIYRFKYSDNVERQSLAAWAWSEVRGKAYEFMKRNGVAQEYLNKLYTGVIEKDELYHPAPEFLFKYFVGEYLTKYNINKVVLPICPKSDLFVHISPVHGKEELTKAIEHKYIPFCEVQFSITFDVHDVEYKFENQGHATQLFRKAFEDGPRLTGASNEVLLA